jgi:transposase-like protein
MTKKRTRPSAEFKAKIALEAAKELKPLNEIASQHNLHPSQISQWKKDLLAGVSDIFTTQKKNNDERKKIDDLLRQIGEITMEREWLKKKLSNFP